MTTAAAHELVHRDDDIGRLRLHTRLLTASAPDAPAASDVVLVHGLGISSRYMTRAMRLLGPHHRVFAPDLPGIGRSSRPPRPLGLPEMADVLVAWMDVLGLARPALLGHSLGAQLVAHVAERHPHRVSRLVLASPSRDPRNRWLWQHAWRLLQDAPREEPSLLPLAVGDYLSAGPRRMWRTLRESTATDPVERLSGIAHPTLVVCGDRDPVTSEQWARTITDLLPAGRLVMVPSAPHAVNYTTAAELVDAVGPFLAAPEAVVPGSDAVLAAPEAVVPGSDAVVTGSDAVVTGSDAVVTGGTTGSAARPSLGSRADRDARRPAGPS